MILNLRSLKNDQLIKLAGDILERVSRDHPRTFGPTEYATMIAFLVETQTRLHDASEFINFGDLNVPN